jgi:rhomboid protease GluP
MNDDPLQDQQVLLRRFSDPDLVNISSLVLSAAKISHRINTVDHCSFEILVQEELLTSAEEELTAYQEENVHWPPVATVDDYTPTFRAMSFVIVGGLVYIYSQSGEWSQDGLWFLHGAGSAEAILNRGEYYRLVTALTLHADIVHILGNCILGGFLIHFFFGIVGNGIGLLAIVTTGALANYINVLVHGGDHNFVGFSTSIFSTIGMLCTISLSGKSARPTLHFFMPVMAGLALLALLGSSGERTDFGGHFFGLVCGLIAGYAIRLTLFDRIRHSFKIQVFSACMGFAIVYYCWQLAFSHYTYIQ